MLFIKYLAVVATFRIMVGLAVCMLTVDLVIVTARY